jgi:hypothetical protein
MTDSVPDGESPRMRGFATLTVREADKRRIERYAAAGRWTQCALIELLLDRFAHELPQPEPESDDPLVVLGQGDFTKTIRPSDLK